jgi:transposase
MDDYSLDLRKKIVQAKERGIPTSEVAKTFGVGVSSVKRYAAVARGIFPRSEKAPRIEAQARPSGEEAAGSGPQGAPGGNTAAERREFLRRAGGVEVSDSTVSRMLRRMGWSRKKIGGCLRARGVPEGRLEGRGNHKTSSI